MELKSHKVGFINKSEGLAQSAIPAFGCQFLRFSLTIFVTFHLI